MFQLWSLLLPSTPSYPPFNSQAAFKTEMIEIMFSLHSPLNVNDSFCGGRKVTSFFLQSLA